MVEWGYEKPWVCKISESIIFDKFITGSIRYYLFYDINNLLNRFINQSINKLFFILSYNIIIYLFVLNIYIYIKWLYKLKYI